MTDDVASLEEEVKGRDKAEVATHGDQTWTFWIIPLYETFKTWKERSPRWKKGESLYVF